MKNKSKPLILVVEDETSIRSMLVFSLYGKFEIIEADTVECALENISKQIPDLILLDWMLPDKSGIELIKILKREALTKEIPIIMLTAKAEEENKIKGLEVGADDYITKPFSPRELIARIQSVLRRGKSVFSPDDVMSVRDLSINFKTHEVKIDQSKLDLTANEYRLLIFFVNHRGQVYSRDQLIYRVWKDEKNITERAVDALIKRLRAKLKSYNYHDLIVTVRGVGYKLA